MTGKWEKFLAEQGESLADDGRHSRNGARNDICYGSIPNACLLLLDHAKVRSGRNELAEPEWGGEVVRRTSIDDILVIAMK